MNLFNYATIRDHFRLEFRVFALNSFLTSGSRLDKLEMNE
jgi:hypothetical protein